MDAEYWLVMLRSEAANGYPDGALRPLFGEIAQERRHIIPPANSPESVTLSKNLMSVVAKTRDGTFDRTIEPHTSGFNGINVQTT